MMTMSTLTTYNVVTTRPTRVGHPHRHHAVVRAASAREARILAEIDYRALFGAPESVFLTSVVDAR